MSSLGPRVTLGIATYNRDTYLGAAIRSALDQDYESLEVLVVVDGSTNPRIDEVLAEFADEPRLRVIRHEYNRGIAAAYNTFVSEGRGELIAMIGDDDLCLPGRISRQVELFERFPELGVAHGDAILIDAEGRRTGAWPSLDLTGTALLRALFFRHNHLVDPTRMVHRRVYEQVGGYDDRFPLANDFDLWLRAAAEFEFRHLGGEPLSAIRRHGENTSDEIAGRDAEIADVELALESALDRLGPRRIVPELDWAVLDTRAAERQALNRIATGLESRQLPLPGLAERLRQRAVAIEPPPAPVRRSHRPRRLLMTSFGFNDSGGGTTVPRLAAKELARRGWEVTVFYAAVEPGPSGTPYEVRESEQDGVYLIGIHNRAHGLFDIESPLRELDDPAITEAFAWTIAQTQPDVVHFHNLHNLGAALIDEAAARGLPCYFTTHNYWLICPRAYLLTGDGEICSGPGDGSRCAACVGRHDTLPNRRRLTEIRARAESGLTRILAVSDAVRSTLLASGYPADLIDVVRQAMPHEQEIWATVGRDRAPGRRGEALTVGFLGSGYPHKGPQLLVEAAQLTEAEIRVEIFGEVPTKFAERLRALDRRGVVRLRGQFAPSEIGRLLSEVDAAVLPSMWWDCAPLAAAECRAARVPLVVPRLGGLPETITDDIDGLAFDALSSSDLAAKLDRLAGEPELLEALQRNIGAPPQFSEYVDQLEAYYEDRHPVAVGGPLAADRVAVRWCGDHGQPTSLSIINSEISSRLPRPVELVDRSGARVSSPGPHPAAVEVRHQWPPDLSATPAGALAAIVPWEFGTVPADWVDQITANVDELWVPSEFVRRMYLDSGVDAERVRVIANGVDLDRFHPTQSSGESSGPVRYLFVGGLIWRKGPDLLLDAWKRAFAERDDVELVVKDFGADGIYASGDRDHLAAYAGSGALPRIELIQSDLDADEVAALYRSADVLVHPYRGEGFAMPVLEAMASGVPVITTAGGPTDEFCPVDAGWRIHSTRSHFDAARLGPLQPSSPPWVLEPDVDHLVELLRASAADADGRARRGLEARRAAERYSWDAAAAEYSRRIGELANRPRKLWSAALEPFPFEEDVEVRVLATPAWRDPDNLTELLRSWADMTTASTSACLYLLADPAVAGSAEEVQEAVLGAAQRGGADLEDCADINVLFERFTAQRDRRLHLGADAYVRLHAGCAGHERLALESGTRVIGPDELATMLTVVRAEAVA